MAELGFHWPTLLVYGLNFLLLLGILYAVAYKPILQMLDQRSERIRESLEEADRVRRESEERHQDIQGQLESSRQEGQQLIAQAREIADKYREEERQKANQEAEALITRARAEIQRERDEAIDEVRSHFAELAIVAAERVLERSIDQNAHKEIIDKVLDESRTIGGN